MPADTIGHGKCPLCGGRARVSLSKAQLAVMTMNCCKAQLFCRGDESDRLVRSLIEAAPPPEPPAAPPPEPAMQAPAPSPRPRLGFFARLLEDE